MFSLVANLEARFKLVVSAFLRYGNNIAAVSKIFSLVLNLDVRFNKDVSASLK